MSIHKRKKLLVQNRSLVSFGQYLKKAKKKIASYLQAAEMGTSSRWNEPCSPTYKSNRKYEIVEQLNIVWDIGQKIGRKVGIKLNQNID